MRGDTRDRDEVSRRAVLIGGMALAGGVLVACSPSPQGGGGGGGSAAPDGGLVALDDVPVGGAVSATAADGTPVIIAQPTAGEVVAFSAICTHLGCTVRPDDDRLVCPCHGSEFETLTGRNVAGPAPRPLDAFEVRVVDGQVVGG